MRIWKVFVVVGAVGICVLLLSGLALAAPSARGQLGAPDVTKGGEVYRNNCAACHGQQGEGNLGIPNLAGAAGHVQQLGIPADQAGPGIVKLLREGIAGNMPAYPQAVLSDEDIANLGTYLFTLPATTGANLYTANCALCHGLKAEGSIGPSLAGAAERFASLGMGKLQLLRTFPDLVRQGIPAKMPGSPQLSNVEVARLGDYLWDLGSWEAAFRAKTGRSPTANDRADRQWSLGFAQITGRAPADQDWIAHFAETLKYRQVTALDLVIGAPPAGGWKWAVMKRSVGASDENELGIPALGGNEHGNDWVFHVLEGSTEIGTPGGGVVLGVGEAEFLTARQRHTHRFPAQSEVLGFRPHPAAARAPDEFHRGEKLLFSDSALETTPGTTYKIRVRDFDVAPGQRIPGTVEVGPSFAYVVEGTLTLSPGQTATAGEILSLTPTSTLVVSNPGTGRLRIVLVDLH